jgi:translation initiation factor 2 beta subunit (eIF-2beta)/eIF-5
MPIKTTVIKCSRCCGQGKIPMPMHLVETLLVVKENNGGVAETIRFLLNKNFTTNAVNNRLEKLRALGFVTRRRQGKFYRYQAVKL